MCFVVFKKEDATEKIYALQEINAAVKDKTDNWLNAGALFRETWCFCVVAC